MDSRVIIYKSSAIHYCVWGSGIQLLFCFHGYGEQAETFGVLESGLGADYTIIGIDIPFHGETEWNEGLLFTVDDLLGIIEDIINEIKPPTPEGGHKTAHPEWPVTKEKDENTNEGVSSPPFRPARAGTDGGLGHGTAGLSLLGYSMGGRIALQLTQKISTRIERLVLVAPDGLHKNRWYRFATQTFIGNKVFKYFMYRRNGGLTFLKIAEKYRLMQPGFAKIVHYYTDDEKQRHRLYCRWTTMRKFKPALPLVKKAIKQNKIPVRLLFGKFDNIIPSSRADVFKDDPQNIHIEIIDAGHRLLQEKYAPAIAALFYQ